MITQMTSNICFAGEQCLSILECKMIKNNLRLLKDYTDFLCMFPQTYRGNQYSPERTKIFMQPEM